MTRNEQQQNININIINSNMRKKQTKNNAWLICQYRSQK